MTQPATAGTLSAVGVVLWTAVSILGALAGGALSGMAIARKDLGNSLAAAMGALYGPIAATPGILVGLIVLWFI